MYHPGSTKKKLSKKKTPLQKNPYTGVHFTHSKKENKKSASPAAATATPRHDASWTQKYRCFWLKKRTTKTSVVSLGFLLVKKVIEELLRTRNTSVLKGWGRSSLESLPLERTILGPPSSLKVSSIVTKAPSGFVVFWGEAKSCVGVFFCVGKLKWRILNQLNFSYFIVISVISSLLIFCCWEKESLKYGPMSLEISWSERQALLSSPVVKSLWSHAAAKRHPPLLSAGKRQPVGHQCGMWADKNWSHKTM